MTPHLTTRAANSLGSWLATLAVSLLLLALAYAHAPDPAMYLGFNSPSARPLATSRPAPDGQHSHHLAPDQAPALVATQLDQRTGRAPHAQFAR